MFRVQFIVFYFMLNMFDIYFLQECSNGTYVLNGKCVRCQGVCQDHAPCNKSTGKCDNVCGDHWTGKFCEGTSFIDFEDTFILNIFKQY